MNPCIPTVLRRQRHLMISLLATIACMLGQNFVTAAEPDAKTRAAASGAVFINLADYAKGDGSDETAAIQKAFDAFNVKKPHHKGCEFREDRGVLFIPTPKKFYGMSRTINVVEKANLVIRCETTVASGHPAYFQWLGPDKGEMFFFNFCWGLRIENLSMSGGNKKVVGIQICDYERPYPGPHPGAFKEAVFDHLKITGVGAGIKLGGGSPNNGADIAFNSFRDVTIADFSEYGFISNTGNGADNTIINFVLQPRDGAKEGVWISGGQLVIMNSCLGTGSFKTTGAAVAVYAGGANIYGCWSEWRGPFLMGYAQEPYPAQWRRDSPGRYSTFLMGVQHYPGGDTGLGEKPESENPVPISIQWNRPVPLTLINNSFWGGVELGAVSQSMIISQGTTFSNRDGKRFFGEGIERYGRLAEIGTLRPGTRDVLEPYVVDRRNTPGVEPPKKGVWKKGDCIRNTDPDPAVPAKAWAGWICVKEGEPGTWVPFGAIGK